VVASALADVTATRQERANLFALDATVFRVGLLAAGLAALAIGLGLGLGPHLIGTDASPTPSIGPTPSDENPPWVSYTNPVLGYELLLPPAWVASAEPVSDNREGVRPGSPVPGVVRFGDSEVSLQPALMISVGTADGEVFICETGICAPETVANLDELDAAVASVPASALGAPLLSTNEVLVDGEVGRIESPRSVTCDDGCRFSTGSGMTWLPGRPQVQRAVTFLHDGRPVVLAFDYFSASLEEVLAIVESFRFLDSGPSAEPSPAPSGSAWRVATDVAHGYALEVPAGWEDRECCSPGVRTFYAGEATPMTIMVGDADGTITICQRGDCAEVVATQLSDLRHVVQAVAPIDAASWGHTLKHDPLLLGDEPAEREWPDSIFSTGPGRIYDWVYTFHDGRPIALRFDHFWGTFYPSERQRILESFVFLD
jgi:hypothetical protein